MLEFQKLFPELSVNLRTQRVVRTVKGFEVFPVDQELIDMRTASEDNRDPEGNPLDLAGRVTRAFKLARAGAIVDAPVDVFQWDAVRQMRIRAGLGYSWVSSALMRNIDAAPGISAPMLQAYDPENPPVGAIIVPSVFYLEKYS